MEIKASIVQKGSIEYNKQEIESGLLVLEEKYRDLVFQEEDVKEAKEERAKLNKTVKAMDTYRKNIIAEATAPIKEFEEFMKEASKRTKSLSDNIADQIKKFEAEEQKIRLEMLDAYLDDIITTNPKYKEFMSQIDRTEKIFLNKGSYNKGDVGAKIVEYVNSKLSQAEEVLKAREIQEKSLQEKRELIISTCEDVSKNLGLELKLSPKTFGYLKESTLSEITSEINRAGREQKEKELAVVERLKKEAERKAELERVRKEKEVDRVMEQPTPVQPKEVEKVDEQKLRLTIEFEIELSKAKLFKKFLEENNIKHETLKKEMM